MRAHLTHCGSAFSRARRRCAGTALDDAIREGHNKVAEGLAGYYRVMEHSAQPQMYLSMKSADQSVKSTKLDQSLRVQAEAVMLGEEKTRTGEVRVDTTPSGSEPIDEPSETQPSGKPKSSPGDRLASQAAAVKNANRAAKKYVTSAAKK